MTTELRQDYKIISDWVRPNSRVLDLGCGSGRLLKHLNTEKNVSGYGLELNEDKIQACIENGVSVIEQDIDAGLKNFKNQSYDFVIMSLALQALKHPNEALEEMLRVGREAIISFPNFAHYSPRLYLALKGKMPVSKKLPYQWYETPNIHLCTVNDFEYLCKEKGYTIEDRIVISTTGSASIAKLCPNLLAATAFYKISKKQ